jgi:cytoskeletal protein CcmA (bactofilin family)
MKLLHRGSDERGAAMVTVMLLVMIAGLLTVVTSKMAVHASQQSGASRSRVAAVHAAEAGVDWAVQQMSLTTGASCTWASSPDALLPGDGPGQPGFTVTVTDSNPVGGCGDDPTDLRRIIRATGRDSVNGPVRTVESEIQLAAKYTAGSGAFSFNDAIFSGSPSSLLVGSGIVLNGQGGNNADVYTAFTGNGTSSSTRTTLSGAADVRGDFVARGGVTMAGSAQIRGDLWANGNVVLSGGQKVWGDILARGSVLVDRGAVVVGNVRATGTITVGGGASIGGTRTPNDASVPVPPARTLPTPPADYSGADWPKPYRAFATCAAFDAWFHNYGAWSASLEASTAENRANVRGTFYVAESGCTVTPGHTYRVMTLTGDTAIVTRGCLEMKGSAAFTQPSGSDHKLAFINLKTGSTPCADSGDVRGIKLAGGAWLNSVDLFIFAANEAWITGGVQVRGQIYADVVRIEGGFSLDFRKHDVGGFTSVSTPIHEGFTPKVLYLRQVD